MSREALNVNTIVRAGAGAGKTTRLIGTIVEYCKQFREEHERFPRIIVCTFTRKATQELRERLMQQALKSRDWDFVRFVTGNQLHVSTIHGVLLKYLTHFGLRLGLDPKFRFVDDVQSLHVAKRIVRDIFISKTLNECDREVILESFDFQTLAEFGQKYFEFSMYHSHAKMHDANSLKVLLEHEYSLANNEFDDFLNQLEPYLNEKPIVQEMANWLGNGKKILEKKDFLGLRTHLEAFPSFRRSSKNPASYEDIFSNIRRLKDKIDKKWISPTYDSSAVDAVGESLASVGKFLNSFKEKYLAHKIVSGEIQISDLEVLSLELIRRHPDTAQLFAMDWDYWMVDEYQDTSPIQVELLKHLQGNRYSFTVGDPQQSIYLFRGARCEVFAAKEEELKQKGGRLDRLMNNYRSRPALVRFFNKVFSGIGEQFLAAEAANPESSLIFSDIKICKRSKGDSNVVAHEVQRLLSKGISANEICVLARTHRALNSAAKELAKFGIPCLVHSAGGFYERREVLDALALLRFLLNPHDDVNFFELIRSPWFHVADQKIVELFAGQKRFSFWSKVKDDPTFAKLHNYLMLRKQLSISEVFRRAMVETGFFDYSHVLDLTGRREANLWKLVNDLEQATRRPGFSFLDFSKQKLNEINLEAKDDQDAVSARESRRVNLMTVHQSKGLQFEHVVLLDIDEVSGGNRQRNWSFNEETGRVSFSVNLPAVGKAEKTLGDIQCQKIAEQREREEFFRIFYVAVTRAIQSLVLVGGEKAKPDSWQAMLGLNLECGDYSEKGFRYCVSQGPWEISAAEVGADTRGQPLQPIKKRAHQGLEKVSVSSLVKEESASKKITVTKDQNISLLDNLEFSNRGIVMHKVLEAIKYQGLEASLKMTDLFFSTEKKEIKSALSWIYNLEAPNLRDLIKNGNVEWGFQFVEGNKVIDGQIDLWGKSDGKVWIVDYKTGSSLYLKKAFAQMHWYEKALRKFGILGDINLAVIFPFEKKIEIQPVNSLVSN
ncbi:MAG: hypothetical protein A4S09_15905 [Proteobacteria bacterium SG_bin7]|nr:MAG: hypothetical protein A4S09_15905 [Proteobacteria bacterium SG_bin7]